MRKTPEPLSLTAHAHERSIERSVPSCVLDALQRGGTDFLGHHPNHGRIRFRIIRNGDTFWVAPHVGGDITTVYAKQRHEVNRWANNYLVNPDQNRHRLALLPNHCTPKEAITDELMTLWALEA